MRKKEPTRHRPFRTPAIWFVAPMGIIFNFGMMLTLGMAKLGKTDNLVDNRTGIYFSYGRKHSCYGCDSCKRE